MSAPMPASPPVAALKAAAAAAALRAAASAASPVTEELEKKRSSGFMGVRRTRLFRSRKPSKPVSAVAERGCQHHAKHD